MDDLQDAQTLYARRPIYDYIPLGVLVVESVCAVLCNGAVLLLFCMRRSLLRTASDLFTINLSLVDLIFSGIVLPFVVMTGMMTINNCNKGSNIATEIEVARNCVVLFGTVATALGTLLVSLDRGDVSLKPSKRFFTHSRAVIAIGLTWSIATIGLAVAILPRLLSLDDDVRNFTSRERKSSYVSTTLQNETRIKYIDPTLQTAETCCNIHPCNSSTIKACTIQLVFEIPIFIAAILTIMIIYGKILWSVQRRSKKYIGTSKQTIGNGQRKCSISKAPACNFCSINACCSKQKRCAEAPEKIISGESTLKTEDCNDNTPPKRKDSIRRKSITAIRNLTSSGGHNDAKKQDSLEDALFVSPSGKTDECNNSSKSADIKHSPKKSKTDFASVAMSVTVVLAIKRMAARKIKERKKKIRHLRKMTFFIIFTFLFCWTPYYFSKLTIALWLHITSPNSSPQNTTDSGYYNNPTPTRRCLPGWVFTWMIAIAALSCILNPVLYMFSREKIRIEFLKKFFPSCSRKAQRDTKRQRSWGSCLLCWDTEDNFKTRSPSNLRRSVINSRWNERSQNNTPTKLKMELRRLPSNSCSREEGVEGLNDQTMPKVKNQARAPLLRWNAVDCDIPDGLQETLKNCDEGASGAQSHGLLIPPSHTRPRSFSAKSVDVLSCSTTIVSLAAEL